MAEPLRNFEYALRVYDVARYGPLGQGVLVHTHMAYLDVLDSFYLHEGVSSRHPAWALGTRVPEMRARLMQLIASNPDYLIMTTPHMLPLPVVIPTPGPDNDPLVAAAEGATIRCYALCLDRIIQWIQGPRADPDDGSIAAENIHRAMQIQWNAVADIIQIPNAKRHLENWLTAQTLTFRDESIRLCQRLMPSNE